MSNIETTMLEHIKNAVQLRADEIRESIIKEATAQFEKELRQAVGQTAINIANYYSVFRAGSDLHISVRIGEEE